MCEGMDGCRYDDEEKGQSRQRWKVTRDATDEGNKGRSHCL